MAWASDALATAGIVVGDSSEAEVRQFIRRVRESPCVPVIAFSSRCDEESALAAVDAGAMVFSSRTASGRKPSPPP